MSPTQIVGASAWTQSLRDSVAQAARFRSTVLITGPSGTGKELIASAIHQQSSQSSQPYIPVDCTGLSGDLFASHLFGHVKGAFTGADYERLGCFRVADQGTIFLDEIGELSAELQAKLLRTIQQRVVVPVGSDEPVPVDVRIIAATNRNLAEEIRAGRFRADLFYRLNVISIETPALKDRVEDIEPLANCFLEQLAVERAFPRKRLSASAVRALEQYSWPGNVRELQNVLERVAVFTTNDVITANDLPQNITSQNILPHNSTLPVTSADGCSRPTPCDTAQARNDAWLTLADIEREHIGVTLAHTFYNQSAAADLLHINRASLAREIRRYQIPLPPAHRGRPSKRATAAGAPFV